MMLHNNLLIIDSLQSNDGHVEPLWEIKLFLFSSKAPGLKTCLSKIASCSGGPTLGPWSW